MVNLSNIFKNIAGYQQKQNYTKAPIYKPIDAEDIKSRITVSLKSKCLVISKLQFDKDHHPDINYEYTLETKHEGLQPFVIPTEPIDDIFSLYFSGKK